MLEIDQADQIEIALARLEESKSREVTIILRGRPAALLQRVAGSPVRMARDVVQGVLRELMSCTLDDGIVDATPLLSWRSMAGMPGAQLDSIVAQPRVGEMTRPRTGRRVTAASTLRRRGETIEAVSPGGQVRGSWSSDRGRIVDLQSGNRLALVVKDDPLVHRGPDEHAAFLRTAGANGIVVLLNGRLPAATRRLLPRRIANVLRDGPAQDSEWSREVWLDRMERAELRRPTAEAVAVISQVSSAHQLQQLVAAVRSQCWPALEICVAGPPDLAVWLDSTRTPDDLVVRPVDDGDGALARAVEAARAAVVTIMRPGDLYGMHHIEGLVQRWEASEADVVVTEVAAVYQLQSDSTAVGTRSRRRRAFGASLGDRSAIYSLVRREGLSVDSTLVRTSAVAVAGVTNAQYVRRTRSEADTDEWLAGGVSELHAGPVIGPGFLRVQDRVSAPRPSIFDTSAYHG